MNQLLQDQFKMLRESRKYLLCILCIVLCTAAFVVGVVKSETFLDFIMLYEKFMFWIFGIASAYFTINQVEKKFWIKPSINDKPISNES